MKEPLRDRNVPASSMAGPLPPDYWDRQMFRYSVEPGHAPAPGATTRSGKRISAHAVRSCCIPTTIAHRSAEVRRQLLHIAEAGDWQNDADTDRLAERLANYAEARRVVLCADLTGGFATLRAHYSGRVAVLGSCVPDDIATALNGGAAGWDRLEDPLPDDVGMVYVPPVCVTTWQTYPAEDVAELASRYSAIPFVMDERWFEYCEETAQEWLKRADNLIILRSLGPAFGLEGLGAGYMLGSERILPEGLALAAEAAVLPLSRRAAMVALVDLGYMREYVKSRLITRRWLAKALQKLGFETVELPGPHVFVSGDCPEGLRDLPSTLNAQNGWLWAIGTPEQVEDQLEHLEAGLRETAG